MIHREINIRSWIVDVFIDDGGGAGYGLVTDCLYGMGAPEDILERSSAMMEAAVPNEAFTYSRGRRSCIYIGPTTSGAEFVNSLVHEIRHLVDHIAEYYDIKNNETVGYLSGDAAFLLAEDICRMGCPCCGKEER